jgi:hypothetical protein
MGARSRYAVYPIAVLLAGLVPAAVVTPSLASRVAACDRVKATIGLTTIPFGIAVDPVTDKIYVLGRPYDGLSPGPTPST